MITAMTIGITGPERKAPRQGGVVRLIIAIIVTVICLTLLALASDFLVDWLWFSSVGYLPVFWTTIGAKAAVFAAVWTGTALIFGVNGWLALRLAGKRSTRVAVASVWQVAGSAPDMPP